MSEKKQVEVISKPCKVIRYVHNVIQNLGTATSWDENISGIEFVPDEMILRLVTPNAGALAAGNPNPLFWQVTCPSLLNNEKILTGYCDGGGYVSASYHPNTIWQMSKPIKGVYKFSVLSGAGAVVAATGFLYLQLEFVKYI